MPEARQGIKLQARRITRDGFETRGGENEVQALDHATQAIERFCVEAEPDIASGVELDSLERVVMSIDILLRTVAGIQTALYVAAQHAARRD